MTLPAAINLAMKRTGASYDALWSMAGRLQWTEDRRMFHGGHVNWMVVNWSSSKRKTAL